MAQCIRRDERQSAWWYYRRHRTLQHVPGIKNVIVFVKANFHTRIIFIGYCLAASSSQFSGIICGDQSCYSLRATNIKLSSNVSASCCTWVKALSYVVKDDIC